MDEVSKKTLNGFLGNVDKNLKQQESGQGIDRSEKVAAAKAALNKPVSDTKTKTTKKKAKAKAGK